jgi:hypothetical protein
MRAEEALLAAAADERATKVLAAADAIEQAGRGLYKVGTKLAAGVPQGNEVHYLIAIQGYINEATFILSELAIPPAAPDEPAGPGIIVG